MPKGEDFVRHMREKDERSRALEHEALPVVSGLRDGDLGPLRDYLKAKVLRGSPAEPISIPHWLADEIVAMIDREPWCWFRLEAVGRSPNVQGWTRELQLENRDFRVGYYVEWQVRERGRGSYEGVAQDAQAHFEVSRAVVKRAHKFVKDWLKGAERRHEEWLAMFPGSEMDSPMDTLRHYYERDLRCEAQSHESAELRD